MSANYTLPSPAKIAGSTFRLNRVQAANPSRGGQHQTVDLAEPLWSAQIATTPLSDAQAGQYDALFARLRGTARTVDVYDARRPRPIAYRSTPNSGVTAASTGTLAATTAVLASHTSQPWGAPFIVGINRALSTLAIQGFTPGATLSPGDYIAWDDGPARRLHIVVTAGTVNSIGAIEIAVEPPPPGTPTAILPATAYMEKAAAEMVIVQFDHPWRVGQSSAASFSAVQVLRRY